MQHHGLEQINKNKMNKQVQYINPDGLFKNPAFSQIVTTQGSGKTIYIGGQNAVNAQREIVGKGDIAEQTEQVMKNIQIALSACGATFDNLIKLTIHIVHGQDLSQGFQASQKYLGSMKNPAAITGFFVSALAHPDFLVEVDAIAFLPEE
jgi:enamine deaminase RidA (YjgF/YER057c/UK114 family)